MAIVFVFFGTSSLSVHYQNSYVVVILAELITRQLLPFAQIIGLLPADEDRGGVDKRDEKAGGTPPQQLSEHRESQFLQSGASFLHPVLEITVNLRRLL